MKTIDFETYVDQLPYLNGMKYIYIPKEVYQFFDGKNRTRVLVKVNENEAYQGGMLNLSEGNAYISINSSRFKKFGLKLGQRVLVNLTKDESQYGMPICEELTEIFRQDEEGNERFHAMSAGKQRTFIYYISTIKNDEKRLEKAIKLIDYLKKTPLGKEVMKTIMMM